MNEVFNYYLLKFVQPSPQGPCKRWLGWLHSGGEGNPRMNPKKDEKPSMFKAILDQGQAKNEELLEETVPEVARLEI
jgi:hypothetical protein